MPGSELQNQAFDVKPAMKSQGFRLAVDSTVRVYDIGSLPWGGVPYSEGSAIQQLFLTIQADGGDIAYQFNEDGSTTMNPATVIAAGGTPSLQASYCAKIFDKTDKDIRIDRRWQRYLVVSTASTATLAVGLSSGPNSGT